MLTSSRVNGYGAGPTERAMRAGKNVFDLIEMFYNSKCKHVRNEMTLPV